MPTAGSDALPCLRRSTDPKLWQYPMIRIQSAHDKLLCEVQDFDLGYGRRNVRYTDRAGIDEKRMKFTLILHIPHTVREATGKMSIVYRVNGFRLRERREREGERFIGQDLGVFFLVSQTSLFYRR